MNPALANLNAKAKLVKTVWGLLDGGNRTISIDIDGQDLIVVGHTCGDVKVVRLRKCRRDGGVAFLS